MSQNDTFFNYKGILQKQLFATYYTKCLKQLRTVFIKNVKKKLELDKKVNLQNYDILRVAGVATFGQVIIAKLKDQKLNYHAIKVVNKEKVLSHLSATDILEATLIRKEINFPFISKTHSTFESKKYTFHVSDFLEGGELFRYLRRNKCMSEDNAKFYALQIALALEYLHFCGIILRKLTPQYILIDRTGYIKLCGLGKAVFANNYETNLDLEFNQYQAPEIVKKEGVFPQSDWWSWGCIVFELVTSFTPFHHSKSSDAKMRILNGQLPLDIFAANVFSAALLKLFDEIFILDVDVRLGRISSSVKNHEWFTIDWSHIILRKITAPFVPKSRYTGINFDKYKLTYYLDESL